MIVVTTINKTLISQGVLKYNSKYAKMILLYGGIMGFLNFLRNKFGKKENNIEEVQEGNIEVDTTVVEETPTIVVAEESEEEKTRKELMAREYNSSYVFYGHYKKPLEIDGKQIYYRHSELFLANSSFQQSISQVIQLTGDDVDGRPIHIKSCIHDNRGTHIIFNINGVEYEISNNRSYAYDLLYSGSHFQKIINDYNEWSKSRAIQELARQEENDEMFKMFD